VRGYHGLMRRSIAIAFLTLFAGVLGCASSDPSVSGIGLFQRRNVFVGDNVRISLPVNPEEGEGWRLTQFDSAILRPQPGSGEVRGRSLTFIFTAAVPGEADLVFQRVRNQRTVDERRRYRVIVRGRL